MYLLGKTLLGRVCLLGQALGPTAFIPWSTRSNVTRINITWLNKFFEQILLRQTGLHEETLVETMFAWTNGINTSKYTWKTIDFTWLLQQTILLNRI